jgi:hypothetical protein
VWQIRLGTVDTFQGEEAKVVIVSLVRNSGSFDGGSSTIGFLKVCLQYVFFVVAKPDVDIQSSNRINVAMSRAKHGLYILGNASNLRQNKTWEKIIIEMEDQDLIGGGFPICCPRHPQVERIITGPNQLPTCAPEGGCLQPCTFRLSCGHKCPSVVCHRSPTF